MLLSWWHWARRSHASVEGVAGRSAELIWLLIHLRKAGLGRIRRRGRRVGTVWLDYGGLDVGAALSFCSKAQILEASAHSIHR